MTTALLLAGKDPQARRETARYLSQAGYRVDEAGDGVTVIKQFHRHAYQLILLDYELPVLNGLVTCRQIKKLSEVPVFLLSDTPCEAQELACFEAGADEYLAKPVSPAILQLRLRVFLRWSSAKAASLPPRNFVYGGLFIDTESHTVTVDDQPVTLTPKEYGLLLLLAQNPGKTFSRAMLLNTVWTEDFWGNDRTVDTHIKTLREKIRPYEKLLVTVRGFGYKLEL